MISTTGRVAGLAALFLLLAGCTRAAESRSVADAGCEGALRKVERVSRLAHHGIVAYPVRRDCVAVSGTAKGAP